MRYNEKILAIYQPYPNAAQPGFPLISSSIHHESLHRLTDALGQYIKNQNNIQFSEWHSFDLYSLLNALLSEDLDMEIKKITGRSLKAYGRQMGGYEHHGIAPYGTTVPPERLADIYQGLATKDPKDWTIAEMALSNVLKGGEVRYVSKVLEFLHTPAGMEYANRFVAFRNVFKMLIKRFSPKILEVLGQKDWTEDLEGDNQGLLRNRIARTIEENHDLDIIQPKLQRLKVSSRYLLALQKLPEYKGLLEAEMNYLASTLFAAVICWDCFFWI